MKSNSVCIEDIGLISHLGIGLDKNIDAILEGNTCHAVHALPGFNDAINTNYLSAQQHCSANNAYHYLCSLLDAALAPLQLTKLSDQQRQNLPVFIGSSSYGIAIAEENYRDALSNNQNAIALALDGFHQISGHLQQQHGLTGPDFAYNTACTASANALLAACEGIRLGLYEQALVLGIESYNLTTASGFSAMQLLAPNNMQPFDNARNGLVLGDGCAALLLRKADITKPGVHLLGGASRSDCYSISASNPDGSEIAVLIEEALQSSNIKAHQINAIKAHGTASPLNDVGEAAAMQRVFQYVPDFFCLKPYIGHTLGACGAMETALLAGLLRYGKLPKSGGFTTPDNELAVKPIIKKQTASAGNYMSNFFGFGGNNCALVLRKQD